MIRLLLAFLAALALAAPAAAAPIDQAGWAQRKQIVALPNGLRMAYVKLGNPRGKPLLLLHGYTDSSRVWTILAPYLEDHRILIPDQRGHGASDAPDCCYSMSQLAQDARQFMDEMEVEKVAVVGHSMGSMVGQLLAAEHPERVSRLVLIGSTAQVAIRRGDWMWDKIMALRQPIASNADFLREWGPQGSPTPVDPALALHYEPEIAATAPHVWRSVIRDLLDVPVGRYASEVKAPVLILSGGKDPLFAADHHASLVKAYPSAKAHIFADLGHNLILERPEEVGPVLARFLRE